jgi:drug/metabolite transporter (DMT)-like permease
MSGIGAAFLLALGSTVLLQGGFLAQHDAAQELPPLSVRRPLASLRALMTHRRWLAGFLVGIAGWGLYVAALSLGTLSLVQAVAAGGVGILAVAVWMRRRERPSPRELVAAAAAVGGLLLLTMTVSSGAQDSPSTAAVGAWLGVSIALAALAAATPRRRGAGLGVAAGLLYAAGDVATKDATLHAWMLIPVVLACHGLAFVALQLGFQRGGPLATIGTSTLLTNAVPILAGIVLFHDRLPHGAARPLLALAFALVVVGAAALALAREQHDPVVPAYG